MIEKQELYKQWPHLLEVNYNGIYWGDINWSSPTHKMEGKCDFCGSDGAEGHQSACRYLFKNQTTPAGREFLRQQIKQAVYRNEENLAKAETRISGES